MYSLIVLLLSLARAEIVFLQPIDASIYNEVLKGQTPIALDLMCDPKTHNIEIQFQHGITKFYLKMNTTQRTSLVALLKKFSEWEKLAKKRKDKFQKDLGTLKIDMGAFRVGSQYRPTIDPELTVTFFSQKAGKYQLVLSLSELKDEIISQTPPALYLEPQAVLKLAEEITASNMTKTLNRAQKKNAEVDAVYK